MKPVKIALFLILVLAWVCVSSAENQLQLRVPVRITEGIYRFKPLSKEELKLFINDRPREILELVQKENVIARVPELGRSFILSFHINEYNKRAAEAVSYFITDVLNYSDMLFIMTPLNIYRVDVSRNKLKMIRDIEGMVKKDCEDHNAKRLQAEKDLEREITRIRWSFQNPYRMPPYFAVTHFLKVYPLELKKFNDQFWLPDVGKYQRIIDFLGLREGERWCIHFQQRDIYAIFSETKQLLQEIKANFSGVGAMGNVLKSNIYSFERELARMDSYSAGPLLNPIFEANINYNSILFGSLGKGNPDVGAGGSFYLEKILKQTAVGTGGLAVDTSDPLEGIKEVVNHRDHYYEVVFDFNGDIEEKRIEVMLADSKTKPVSREKFTIEEIEALIHYLSKEKVKVEEIAGSTGKNKRGVSFAIKSFEMREPLQPEEGGEKFGVLRVRIQLHNQWGERVYNSERMLRVNEETVTVSHTFLPDHQGEFIINIFVTDLIRNSSVSFTGEVTLNSLPEKR